MKHEQLTEGYTTRNQASGYMTCDKQTDNPECKQTMCVR